MGIVKILTNLLPKKQKYISEIKAYEYHSDMEIISNIQSNRWNNVIHHRELKLLLQDCEQARAAYPHFSFEKLTEGRWFLLDKDTFPLLPENMQKNMGCAHEIRSLMPVVRPQFSKRTSPEEATSYLKKEEQRKYEKHIRELRENGPSFSSGSIMVSYNKSKNEVIVKNTPYRTSIGTIWEFPFVLEEWISLDCWVTLETIKNLPSFQQVRKSFVKIKPRVSGIPFSGPPEDAFLRMQAESEEIERREFSLREELGLNAVH